MYSIEYRFDFDISIDPYRADTGGRTEPRAYIRPMHERETILVIVEQIYPGQNGMDPDDFQDVLINYGTEEWMPDPTAFEALMKSEKAQALLQRIAAGYSAVWPNERFPGSGFKQAKLNQDATAALEELDALIEDLPADTREFWTCADWFMHTNFCDMDAEEIAEYIANPTGGEADIVLIDDVEEYIMHEVFTKLAYDLKLEEAPDTTFVHNGYKVTVEIDENGDIARLMRIETPAGRVCERQEVFTD